MNKIAKKLTEYIIKKNVITETNRELYEFGFLVVLEKGLFLLICLGIAIFMNVFWNAFLFFLIFIPLRSYAGGLHFNNYKICFFVSCVVYIFVLFSTNFVSCSNIVNMLILLTVEGGIYYLYPVEHINRAIDDDENNFFKKKLFIWLCIDAFIAIVCLRFSDEKYLQIVINTLLVVFITMIMGKIKTVA